MYANGITIIPMNYIDGKSNIQSKLYMIRKFKVSSII